MKNKQKQYQLRDVLDVIDLISGKWRGAILASLCDKEKRFNELKRDLETVTARTLIKELKYLELNKLLSKEEDKENPNLVKYKLTKHGKTLEPLIIEIVTWGQKHRKVILGK